MNQNNQATGFGLFALSGKLTSFIGPLLVGLGQPLKLHLLDLQQQT